MSKAVPAQALVVVADGGKAIFLRNTGTGGDVALHEERRLSPKDVVNDGPSGSRPEDQSPRQTDEATFAKQLAHTLHTMHQGKDFEALVLILDPQTLGQLRDCLHKTVEATVVRTLAKDLTNHATKDIAEALAR